MPVCELCDGESFYDNDGKYYCTDCNTQSQDIQVEVKQEGYSQDTVTLGLKTSTKKKIGAKRKPHDMGKPWVAYEGFQYMIKSQVEALIAMGFNKKLKDVVGKLWFHYLKLKKVAFCKEEPEIITMGVHSKRLKNEGVLPPWVRKKRNLIKKEEKMGVNNKKTEEGDDDLLKEIEDELDKIRPPSDQEMSTGDETDGIEDSSDDENPGSIGTLKLKTAKTSLFDMKQRHTLCFCYLGLCLLKEPVLLSDLIRWTHEGMLPYHKSSRVIPAQMKFSACDFQSFCNKLKLNLFRITRIYGNMVSQLHIDLKLDKGYRKITVASVIVDLEFSSSVQSVAWYLIDADYKKIRKHLYKEYIMDVVVAAYIIVAVKFVYYLDGYHEWNNQIRNSLLEKLKLPLSIESWKKWVTRSMLKHKMKLYNGIPRTEDDLKHIHDLSVYEDYCIKDAFKSFDIRNATASYYTYRGRWKTNCDDPKEKYYKPFYSVAQELNPGLNFEGIKRVPTSFPFSVDHLGELIQYNLDKDVTASEFEKNNGSHCTKENYGDNSITSDYGDNNITSDYGDKGNVPNLIPGENTRIDSNKRNNTNQDSDDRYKTNTSESIPESQTSINKDKTVNESSYDLDKLNINISADGNNIHSSFNENIVKENESYKNEYMSNRYVYYPDNEDEDGWTDSYRYLMGVIARRMEIRPRELQIHVRRLELRYFLSNMRRNEVSRFHDV